MKSKSLLNLKLLFLIFSLAFFGASATAHNVEESKTKQQKIKNLDLIRFFQDTKGTIVIYDAKNKIYLKHDEARAKTRFSPFSTFKIPNSLIGLETKVLQDADTTLAWDKQKYPGENWTNEPQIHWKGDHNLRSALKYSVLWYYRELAKKVGDAQMQSFVAKFDYGNADVSGGLSSERLFEAFWLNSTLKISANEQIEFLKKFYDEKLPVSKRSLDIVKDVLVLEETPNYKLSGKTGGGFPNGKALGWFVGYLETKDNTYFYALNIDGESFAEIREKRIDLTKQILIELGFMKK